MNFDLEQTLKNMIIEAVSFCTSAHNQIFENNNESASLSYLSLAAAKMSGAEALYYAGYEKLHKDKIELIFECFYAFSRELVDSFANHQKHQWTNIHYQRLVSVFDSYLSSYEK